MTKLKQLQCTSRPSDAQECASPTLHNSQLRQRGRGGPEAVLDIVKDSKYPHTTCSALSLSWRREDNVLSYPPTLTASYLCLFVKCLLQHKIQKRPACTCEKQGVRC